MYAQDSYYTPASSSTGAGFVQFQPQNYSLQTFANPPYSLHSNPVAFNVSPYHDTNAGFNNYAFSSGPLGSAPPPSISAEPYSNQFPAYKPQEPTPRRAPARVDVTHPYARIVAKKEEKRRRIWNHALEKLVFDPYELSTLGAPYRRTIYVSSLEAHIDQLHAQLLSLGFWPVAFEKLEPFRGLNSRTAKSMVSGLQHDASVAKLKLLELERSNNGLRQVLEDQGVHQSSVHNPQVHRM